MNVQGISESRELAAPELDEVSGGVVLELLVLAAAGTWTAIAVGCLTDSVAVRDGKVLINGIPQN
jgi:hypothetical protein